MRSITCGSRPDDIRDVETILGRLSLDLEEDDGAARPPVQPRSEAGYDQRVSAIVQQRDRRMAEIRSLCCQGLAPGSFVHKANMLLTFG